MSGNGEQEKVNLVDPQMARELQYRSLEPADHADVRIAAFITY